MSKTDVLLKACKEHVGEWVCSLHNSESSNQPAAIFREIKKLGYEFEETTSGRWVKKLYCPICGHKTSHYKLLNLEPTLTKQERIAIDADTRERILKLFNKKDAFTGGSITSTPEIDHKVPWTRLDEDIDARTLSDDEIKEHFQLLTREHNLLKDRACGHCKLHGERPPFLGISFWYEGDARYCGTCEGCGWYDGEKWRKAVSEKLNK